MTLTKKQQELIIHMICQRGFRLNPKIQNIYNSSALNRAIQHLKKMDLIRSFKTDQGQSYQLTDKGIFIGGILTKAHGLKIKYLLYLFY